MIFNLTKGEVPEWPNGAGCKPAGVAYGGSNPSLPTCAHVAQREEHILGKDEVTGSSPVMGSFEVSEFNNKFL